MMVLARMLLEATGVREQPTGNREQGFSLYERCRLFLVGCGLFAVLGNFSFARTLFPVGCSLFPELEVCVAD